MSESFNPLENERKYTVELQWGMANVFWCAVSLKTDMLLYLASTEHKRMTRAQALSLRPLLKLGNRLYKRRCKEREAGGTKRKSWKCQVTFDELIAVVECCTPDRHDNYQGIYMLFHQKAASLDHFVVIP